MTRSRLLIAVLILTLLGLIYPIGLLLRQSNRSEPRYSIQDLGVIDRGNWVHLNNLGHVAFTHFSPNGHVSYLWTLESGRQMVAAATENLHVHGLSDRDEVVGSRSAWADDDHTQGYPRACVWSSTEGLVDLAIGDELKSWAYHIHDDGRILGMYEVEDGTKHIVIWSDEGVIEGQPLSDFWDSLDNRTEWVTELPDGFDTYTDERRDEGCKFLSFGTNGTRAVGGLSPPPTTHDRISRSIRKSTNPIVAVLSDLLKRVGLLSKHKDRRFAFLWDSEESIDLNRLIPEESDWDRLVQANGVNDKGQIVGVGIKKGSQRLFLLTPVGED